MSKSRFSPRELALAGIIAGIYAGLTLILPIPQYHGIQLRVAEAMTLLPFLFPAAVPGLAIGCMLANLLTGAVIYDVIFGALATLLGALGAYALRRFTLRRVRFLLPVATILANVLIVPFVLQYAYRVPDAWWFLCLTVGIGEMLAAGVGGVLMTFLLDKYKSVLFR